MSKTQNSPSWGLLYIASVIVGGLAVIAYSLADTLAEPPGLQWLVLAALTLLSGSFTVKIPSLSARLSVSETFVFSSALLFGAEAGTLTVVLDALVIVFWLNRKTRSPSRVLFNITAPALAFWIAAVAFFSFAQIAPGAVQQRDLRDLVVPLFTFALLYFLINTWLVAGALAWERGLSAPTIWFKNFAGLSINYFVGSSVAILLVAYTSRIDFTALSIIIPLLLISYYTFRSSMGRLDDANRHVAQLNELYMSTIEALAMAVDAKDQITHGHIRRVQVYALELAKRVGVTDDRQLKAIEAAALLHDMGKLAIPEHILNKPGRLTPAEFDRMKQHAGLGADLLSSIRFPYPVVPIVRHHHENWDGSGYPSGVSTTDIPLGARILSVVDCFDALTSDRPYRPRLSTDDAFGILRDRRGTMYDPLVVDTFIQAYAEIAPAALKAGEEAPSIFPTEGDFGFSLQMSKPLKQIRASATESALLIECAQSISRAGSVADAFGDAAQCLRQLIPATVFALYRYRSESDSLVCEHSIGDSGRLLDGLNIRAGQRITGWCAATRRTSLNSDASLDLAQIAELFQPALRSTLGVPLYDSERLIGVLTAYSTRDGGFNESHSYTAEQVGQSLSEKLKSFMPFPSSKTVVPFSAHKDSPRSAS